MSTPLVIGGWFAQSFIQTLLDKASNCAIQQLARRRGLHDDLRRLRTSLLRIHAILDKAETRWNHKNTSLVELVRQLKDAAYDAEDLLEELEYQAAKQKVEHRGDQISDLFSFSLSTASEWLGADGDDAGTRLREIQGKLCNIAADMMDVMQLLAPDEGGRQFDWKMVRRETSSFLTENVVFGRDQEREKDMLTLEELPNLGQLPHLKDMLTLEELPNLGQLPHLKDMLTLEELPNLGQLPHLKVIHMKNMFAVKHIGRELYGDIESNCFLSLEELVLQDMLTLEELPNLGQLPHLKVIHMKNMFAVKHIGRELYGDIESNCFLSLEELVLQDMLTLEELPNLGQLPHLKVIHMKNMFAVKHIGRELYGDIESNCFLSLEELVLQDMLTLEELPNLGQLPHLKGVKKKQARQNCHRKQYLEALELEWAAGQVSSLEHELLVSEEDMLTLEELPNLGQLPHLKVIHMKNMFALKLIDRELCGSREKIWFPRLEVLVLKNMLALEELPSLGQLPCLKVLRIQVSKVGHGLFSATRNKWFPRLEELEIKGMLTFEELHSLEKLPCLKVFRIKGLPAVKKIGHGLFDSTCQREGFPRLEELVLRDMPAWEEWSWAEREELFSCLCRLKIEQCPKLKCLPPVPHSLIKLELWQVGLTGLPGLCKGIGGGSSTRTASLSLLHIIKCPNLRNLEEGLLSNHLPHINAIRIWECAELLWLPVKRFREFTTLENLSIRNCPKLMSMTQCEENDLLLPPSIKALELGDCGNLGKSLPGCLHNLSSLTQLVISNCPHMVSFPREVMLHLKELGTVWIRNCDGLRSIEGLQVLKSLERLAIIGCPRLLLNEGDEQGEVLSLLELSVDKTALLKLSLIKNTLPFIHSLRIILSPQKVMFDWEEQELVHSLTALRRLEFLSCKNLQSLPTELHTLPSLRALVVSDCPQIQSLPEKGLPTLLTDLGFDHCHPVLTAQLEKHLAEMKSSVRMEKGEWKRKISIASRQHTDHLAKEMIETWWH
ncbi:hypothetical protein C4D60_Mb06t35360 [Musa balbisiana]|uniref:Disease resistance N-terminal domain-containing protein n=1 Tax=Musa balbisiana TaxID=52838 RepID=A0A4S8ISX8_MUSBA|nr:hypothetical protein C4D60_Mb06t35360 [Musa balbisiana]